MHYFEENMIQLKILELMLMRLYNSIQILMIYIYLALLKRLQKFQCQNQCYNTIDQ